MGHNSLHSMIIIIPKPHIHLQIFEKQLVKFQISLVKDVAGFANARSKSVIGNSKSETAVTKPKTKKNKDRTQIPSSHAHQERKPAKLKNNG